MVSSGKTKISEAFKELEARFCNLSPNQVSFIKSLKKYFKKFEVLSEKQQAILFEMRKYLVS